jgi:uncharacterized protein YukE
MTEFYVDPAGLGRLTAQLARASDDAGATLDYTRQHCDLAWNAEGLLMIAIGPHEHVYGNITGALTKLQQYAHGAAGQIDAARADYASTDQAAAARLDSGYPGATDSASLRGALAPRRPDLLPQHTAFKDVAHPGDQLRNPEYAVGVEMWTLNPLADLISPAAWLRQVSIWVFGVDPFESWASELGGDWRAYVHCAAAFGRIGSAAHDIGANLVTGAQDVSEAWRGSAAEGEQEFQLALGSAAAGLQPALSQYGQLYNQSAEVAKNLCDVVSGLITDLLDTLIIINAASAAGTALIETGIGAVAGYGIAAYYIARAVELYEEISKLYGNAEDLIKAISATINTVQVDLAIKDLPGVRPYHHPAGY